MSYKVYPEGMSSQTESFKKQDNSSIINIIGTIQVGSLIIGFIWVIVNLFSGGYGWMFFAGIVIVSGIIRVTLENEDGKNANVNRIISEAQSISYKLNDILAKSEEIVNEVLPFYEISTKHSLDIAKKDFADNAISPFWDKIEEASKSLALYKEAVDQLKVNGEIYTKILEKKEHNFPRPFPIKINMNLSDTIDDFNVTVRKAQTKFEFANIWEHRKTQKILIAGFLTLGQAINNMKEDIVSSIGSLEYAIRSEFRELKSIQFEQIRSFESGYKALNDTLTTMDNKLYYLQYKQRPITPFVRPLSEHFR